MTMYIHEFVNPIVTTRRIDEIFLRYLLKILKRLLDDYFENLEKLFHRYYTHSDIYVS